MENGNQIRAWAAQGGTGVLAVRYARDGRIVSTGRDRLTRLWDGNGGAQRTFEPLSDVGMRSTFSHDGARVVSGDWSGQLVVWNTADGKRLGTLTANPPSVAEQVALAEKDLAVKQKTFETLTASATASQSGLQKTLADLAAAQKAVTDTAAATQAARVKLNQASENLQKGKVVLAASQSEARAKGVLAQALAEAANKVKAEADKAPADKALATAAGKARTLADQAQAELTQAQKVAADQVVALRQLEMAMPAAQQALVAAQAAEANAPKVVAALAAGVKPAQERANAAQGALNAAATELKVAQAALARWRAAQLARGATASGK
jgi:hypothetical protein